MLKTVLHRDVVAVQNSGWRTWCITHAWSFNAQKSPWWNWPGHL